MNNPHRHVNYHYKLKDHFYLLITLLLCLLIQHTLIQLGHLYQLATGKRILNVHTHSEVHGIMDKVSDMPMILTGITTEAKMFQVSWIMYFTHQML